jgi:hypothetical protein
VLVNTCGLPEHIHNRARKLSHACHGHFGQARTRTVAADSRVKLEAVALGKDGQEQRLAEHIVRPAQLIDQRLCRLLVPRLLGDLERLLIVANAPILNSHLPRGGEHGVPKRLVPYLSLVLVLRRILHRVHPLDGERRPTGQALPAVKYTMCIRYNTLLASVTHHVKTRERQKNPLIPHTACPGAGGAQSLPPQGNR